MKETEKGKCMKAIKITLTDKMLEGLDCAIKNGMFATRSEGMRDAWRHYCKQTHAI